ncbi:hypothetical protein FDUTEX481_07031 [Tolypothrix sp. PCC 7601]|nr:hypothetical protein FDUTEX481_07031 [Tolypothrix sp. PCC 7601]
MRGMREMREMRGMRGIREIREIRQHRLTFKSCRDAIDRVFPPQHQNYRVSPTPKIIASFPHPNYDEKFLTNLGDKGKSLGAKLNFMRSLNERK